MNEVHICPILMKTVIWSEQGCQENCGNKECPLDDLPESAKTDGRDADYSYK